MAADDVLPTRSPDLVVIEVEGSWVVYDPRWRQAHLLNLTAGLVLDACDGATTVGELCEDLAAGFTGADTGAMRADVEASVADSWARGLMTDSPAPAPDGGTPPRPAPPLRAEAVGRDDGRQWAWEPPALDVLGTAVRLRVEHPELARAARDALAPLLDTAATTDGATLGLDLVTDGAETVLWRGSSEVVRTPDPARALPHLLWELNQVAADGKGDAVVLHAAAVRGPHGLAVLPADSESGKSTLAAGLVRAGLDYLTDEAVGFDLGTGAVRVYPRAIGLGPGSWPLFPEAAPAADLRGAGYFADEWHVDPWALRPAALDGLAGSSTAPVVVVAFPRYVPGEVTRLDPVPRASALLALLHNAFNLADVGEGGVLALDELSRVADTVHLVSGDLDEAVALIAARLGASTVAGR